MSDSLSPVVRLSRFANPGWRGVVAIFAFNGFLFGVWASRIPAIADKFALDEKALSLVLLGLAGGAILSFPLAGVLSDRIGAVTLTRILACLYAPALLAIAVAPSLVTLSLAVIAFGAVFGAMDVAMNGWGAEVEIAARRPFMSGFHAMFSLGAGLGAGSGAVAIALGLTPLEHFAVAALAMPLALWTARHRHADAPERTPREGGAPIFSLPHGRLVMIGLIAFSVALGEGSVADWSAVFLVVEKSATEAFAPLGFMVFNVAMVTTRLCGDFIVGRFGPTVTVRLSAAVAIAGVLVCVLAPTASTALTGFGLMGIGFAVVMPLAFSAAARDDRMDKGRALASVATLGYGGMLIGPVLIGMLAELASLEISFLIIAALCGLSFMLAPQLKS